MSDLDHLASLELERGGGRGDRRGPPGGEPQPFRILIDGTHRATRKLRDHEDCWAFLLTEEEQFSICTYRLEGRVAELPSFPGPGITDREAGLFLSLATGSDVA